VCDPANLAQIWLLQRKGFVVSHVKVENFTESNKAAPEKRRKKKAESSLLTWDEIRKYERRLGNLTY
jgi:hypothetical protein